MTIQYIGAVNPCSLLGCSSEPLNALEQLVLNKHNEFRSKHQDTPPLCYAKVTGEDTAFTAQNWADRISETRDFKQSPHPRDFGENLSWSSYRGEDPDPGPFYISAVERWYRGVENWDFELGVSKGMTNAFTQLVWKSSTHLNCGFATSEDLRRAYVVCQYWPKGNWIKRSLYYTEVGPPIGSGAEDTEVEGESC